MDIQVSSNFERLLFDILDRPWKSAKPSEPGRIAGLMQQLKDDHSFKLDPSVVQKLGQRFSAHCVDETQTLDTIRTTHERTGYLLDPHTAVGVAAAQREIENTSSASPMVVLATAHPAKFPDAVEKATGLRPPLPDFLADLHDRPERCDTLANNLADVQQYIEQKQK